MKTKANKSRVRTNKNSLTKRVGVWRIVTVLISFVNWYFNYHKPIRRFLGLHDTTLVEKKKTTPLRSIKAENKINTRKYRISSQTKIDFQKARKSEKLETPQYKKLNEVA